METVNIFISAIKHTSYWEWQAMFAGILYLYFAIRERIICWVFAFISATTYIYVSHSAKLHLDAILQVFYVIMAMVGFVTWNKQETTLPMQRWSFKQHSFLILIVATISLFVGYFFEQYTDQSGPYLNALTTCFSLVTTYMVAKKVVDNWVYWVIIDSIMVYLYFSTGLIVSSGLMIIYTLMAMNGYFIWKKNFYQQQKAS